MPERAWRLGEDLSTYDALLDGITFDDLITAVHHNCRVITPTAVYGELAQIIASRKQDMAFLVENNMDLIIAEAMVGRN